MIMIIKLFELNNHVSKW